MKIEESTYATDLLKFIVLDVKPMLIKRDLIGIYLQ